MTQIGESSIISRSRIRGFFPLYSWNFVEVSSDSWRVVNILADVVVKAPHGQEQRTERFFYFSSLFFQWLNVRFKRDETAFNGYYHGIPAVDEVVPLPQSDRFQRTKILIFILRCAVPPSHESLNYCPRLSRTTIPITVD